MRNVLVAAAVLLSACATELKAPTADAGAARRVPVGQLVQLDGSASADPASLPLAFAWSFRSLPPGSAAKLNDARVVRPSFVADVAGAYVVDLTVSNGTKQSGVAEVVVTADPTVGAVLPQAGFTITTVAAGPSGFLVSPRGVAVGQGGDLFVMEGGDATVPPRLTRLAATGAASIVAQRGYLAGAQDVLWTGTELLATTGGPVLVKVSTAGVQSVAFDTTSTSDLRLQGLSKVTPAAGGTAFYVGDSRNDELLSLASIPATTATRASFNGAPGGGTWGVTGFASGGVDQLILANRDEVWRQTGTAAPTVTRLAAGGLLVGMRKVLVTPCATPKLVVAARDTGAVLVLDPACTGNDCASATAQQLVVGLGNPYGMDWDLTDAANPVLVVTDESLDAVYRVKGNFCAL
ncbi:MAG TPA: PKD domain-containing protein [Anaeromyxobacteraceae bacterium]|nr:PKD domain-containing protein [Anaeromyxobacteraceae bacterium]